MRSRFGTTAALLTVTLAAVVVGASGVAYASDNGGQHICLSNARRSCVDLKNDRFRADNNAVVYSRSGTGLGWKFHKIGTVCDGQHHCGETWPFQQNALNRRYNGRPVFRIYKTRGSGTDGCLEAVNEDSPLFAAWNPCNTGITGTSWWIYSSTKYLVNVLFTANGDAAQVLTAHRTRNGSLLYLDPPAKRFHWQQWRY